jgi:hypothetical protein
MARAMLMNSPMARARLLPKALVGAAVLCGSTAANAQTISASGQPYPNRILPDGQNLGYSTRPQNLTPLGISYADCVQDQTLQFSVTLTGFTGSDTVEVWGSLTSPCTATGDRGVGAGVTAVCWGLRAGNLVDPVISTPQTYTFNVRVQDLVGWQVNLPTAAEAADPPAQGASACSAQPTFAAVPMNINFLAINGDGNSDGTPYQYNITTDMVGPPAPLGVTEAAGDTLMKINWTPNSDSDSAGYDVFMDPPPGGTLGETSVTLESGTVICPGSSGTAEATVMDLDGADIEASIPEASATDGACYSVNTGSSTQGTAGSHCNDPILQASILQEGGVEGGTYVAPVYDEAGDLLSEGGVEGTGGISTIPLQYLVGGGSQGETLSDKTVGQYQVTGLTDGTWYNVVVAAVDGTGNVGPASPEVCDYPAPVQDFWQTYRQDGGMAGGFCALETVGVGGPSLAGVGAVFVGAAIARRRRRRNGPRA